MPKITKPQPALSPVLKPKPYHDQHLLAQWDNEKALQELTAEVTQVTSISEDLVELRESVAELQEKVEENGKLLADLCDCLERVLEMRREGSDE